MKKLLVVTIVLMLLLTACGNSLSNDEISGEWNTDPDRTGDRIIINADGTYDITYASPIGYGEGRVLVEESGKYELSKGKITFMRRDIYTQSGDNPQKFERLHYTEDRSVKIRLLTGDDGAEILKIDGTEYYRTEKF